jgi:hypothetical protein
VILYFWFGLSIALFVARLLFRPRLPKARLWHRWAILSLLLLSVGEWILSQHMPHRYKIHPKQGGCWILTVKPDGSATSEPAPCNK